MIQNIWEQFCDKGTALVMHVRSQLMQGLLSTYRAQKLTPEQLASKTGLDQNTIQHILRGHIDKVSIDELLMACVSLDVNLRFEIDVVRTDSDKKMAQQDQTSMATQHLTEIHKRAR